MEILAISDTHGLHETIWEKILADDALDISRYDTIIHTGDISALGHACDVEDFIDWFGTLPFKNKVFILGNHEVNVELNKAEDSIRELVKLYPGLYFLHHETIVIDGVTIFGSPYTPHFRGWAYNVSRVDLYDYWQEIPLDVDLILTHGPCFGIGDSVGYEGRQKCGDVALLNRILELKKLGGARKEIMHQFGHIHGGKGRYEIQDQEQLYFINASCLKDNYDIQNRPYEAYAIYKESN